VISDEEEADRNQRRDRHRDKGRDAGSAAAVGIDGSSWI